MATTTNREAPRAPSSAEATEDDDPMLLTVATHTEALAHYLYRATIARRGMSSGHSTYLACLQSAASLYAAIISRDEYWREREESD